VKRGDLEHLLVGVPLKEVRDQILAEFDSREQEEEALRITVTALEKCWNNDRGVLDGICEPIKAVYFDGEWHGIPGTTLGIPNEIEKARSESLAILCTYLDSQREICEPIIDDQMSCFLCGKTGVTLEKTGEALACNECITKVKRNLAKIRGR